MKRFNGEYGILRSRLHAKEIKAENIPPAHRAARSIVGTIGANIIGSAHQKNDLLKMLFEAALSRCSFSKTRHMKL